MQNITLSITNSSPYQALYKGLLSGETPALAVGLPPIAKAQLAAALRLETSRPICIITDEDTSALRLASDLQTFSELPVVHIPSRELSMAGMEGMSRQYEQARIEALSRLQTAPLITLSAAALVQKTLPPHTLAATSFTIHTGDLTPLTDLIQQLICAGYQRCAQVEGSGQFSVRGGILDVFPPCTQTPVRIEYWGDEIDSMARFDVGSQRRGDRIDTLVCLPCMETLPSCAHGGISGLCKALDQAVHARRKKHPDLIHNVERDTERLTETQALPSADKYLPLIYPDAATPLAYLPENTIFLIDDTPRLREAVRGYTLRLAGDLEALTERGELPQEPDAFALDFSALCKALSSRPLIRLDTFLNTAEELLPKTLVSFVVNQMNPFGSSFDIAAADIQSFLGQNRAVCVVCSSELRCKNMQEELAAHDIHAPVTDRLPALGHVHILEGSLSSGLEYPELGLILLSEGHSPARKKASRTKKSNRDRVKSYADLTPGDLVVHEHHGIGRYIGMERMKIDGAERDFVKIAFAGTDFLYIPATSLDLISKYIGGSDPEKVRLNKLGGTDWQRARTRAKAAAKELAAGLLQLYAERSRLKGYAFPPDDVWQREFEQSFPYEETEDQLRCIAEIKQDMQSDRPMDRLLCGDVGFGKTEVALRAVMKCILAGKQAAILVPTTVLARQHYLTAIQRFAGYPVKIDLISRHKTPSEQKKILEQLQNGIIDVIIGTHKLFNKKIQFHDLGLLVIDEEQRFGVSHKETLKEMSKQVDVLTLSATPIPRTLNMALSGIRDMSAIEEPPHDRWPVQTYVAEYNELVIHDAIRRELARGGQVYYLHNYVESIEQTALRLQKDFPDARIGIAHGKMHMRELSNVMNDMSDGALDILVCTTIIETGIDIPNANTLIIENADCMGLAQLHQIRGRVGRSSRRAFAYLTFRRGKVLSETSQKRLSAIREFAEFGSGFKIAMRDLEIRGAGNVLGPEQSGHMMSVGYDLYLKLLEEAVLEEKGETPPQRVECAAEFTLSANLPAEYVSDPGQRVDLYRRIALIRSEEGRSDLLDELIDRYGEPPSEAIALLDIALIRAQASEQGLTEIKQENGRLLLTFVQADFRRLSILCGDKDFSGRLLLNAGSTPYLSLRLNANETPLAMAQILIQKYADTQSAY